MFRKIVLLVAVVAVLLAVGISYSRTQRVVGAEVTLLEVGDVAPDFMLFGVDYRYHSLSLYPEVKAIAVIFHCNHCPISQGNRETLVALANEFKDKNVQFLVINPNPADVVAADGFPQMRQVAEEQGYDFPYLYDETQLTAAAYGARRTDHVFVLGPADNRGQRRIMHIGPIDNGGRPPRYTALALNAVLNDEPLEHPEVDAFGCTIKYRNAEQRKARGVVFP